MSLRMHRRMQSSQTKTTRTNKVTAKYRSGACRKVSERHTHPFRSLSCRINEPTLTQLFLDLSNFLVEKALDHQESKMSVLTRADLDLPSFADLDIDGYVEPTRNQIIFGFLLFLLFPPLACILMYAVIKLDDPRNGIFSTPGFVLSDLLHCVIAGIGVSGYLCRCFNAGWTLRRIVLFTVTFTGTELGGFIALAYAWRFPTPLAFPVVVGLAVQSSFFVLCLDIYGAKKLRDWNFAKRFAPLLGLSGKGNFRLPFPYHPKQRNEDHCFLRTPSEYAGIVE